MGLRCNGNQFASCGMYYAGAAAILSAYPSALQNNFSQTGRIRNLTAGEGITNELVGIPSGYRHPAAWMMPQKPGLLAARNTAIGSGGVSSATMQSGYNIAAGISGAGDIPGCDIGLIVAIAATITASGDISSADATALATMVATITGSGDIAATAAGLADLGATLAGAGVVVAGNTALMDIAATIRGYSALTPEGIRDSVWDAILANYLSAGSTGAALSAAGGAGDPWITTLPGAYAPGSAGDIIGNLLTDMGARTVDGAYTQDEVTRIIAAVLAGKVSGAGTGTETFRGINDDKDRVVATVDSSGNRTAITLDGS